MNLDALLDTLAPGGGDFERLCKWMLENAPEYRRKVTRVWRWNDWPARWGPDAGIDLVAETEDGLWAVQGKHYDAAYAVRKADIDSFLSESSRPEFSYRLLIASTDHIGPTARRTMAAQEKPVGMLMRSQLLGLEVEWPASLVRFRAGKPKRKKPRPHQQRAIRECAHWSPRSSRSMRSRSTQARSCSASSAGLSCPPRLATSEASTRSSASRPPSRRASGRRRAPEPAPRRAARSVPRAPRSSHEPAPECATR
jgi:hypothetical protein